MENLCRLDLSRLESIDLEKKRSPSRLRAKRTLPIKVATDQRLIKAKPKVKGCGEEEAFWIIGEPSRYPIVLSPPLDPSS